MYRIMLSATALSTTLGMTVGIGHAESDLGDAHRNRFERSRIEVQNTSDEGRVVKKGTILLLQADQVPAARFRTIQANTSRRASTRPTTHRSK